MLMQPKGNLDVVAGPIGQLKGDRASDQQSSAIERARRDRAIRVTNLSMASEKVMADASRSGWICLEVRTGREYSVQDELNEWKIVSFLPLEGPFVVVRRGRKIDVPSRPVFAGYIFVRCALIAPAILGLLSMRNVIGVVGGAENPIPLSDKSINRFRQVVESGEAKSLKPKTNIKAGDAVCVDVGPYASFEGNVEEVRLAKKEDGAHVAVVALFIFGRYNPVRIPLAHLKKL